MFISFSLIWHLPNRHAEYLSGRNIHFCHVALPGSLSQSSGGDRSRYWEQTTTRDCRPWFSSVLWSNREGVIPVSCPDSLINPSVLKCKHGQLASPSSTRNVGWLVIIITPPNIRSAGLPHVLTKSDNHKGYHLPKGAVVMANIWSVTFSCLFHQPPKICTGRSPRIQLYMMTPNPSVQSVT